LKNKSIFLGMGDDVLKLLLVIDDHNAAKIKEIVNSV
jgi:hypothetical protein